MSCESGTASSRAAPEPTSVGPSRARALPSWSKIEPSLIFCKRVHGLVVLGALALLRLEVHRTEPLDLLIEVDPRGVQLSLDRVHPGGVHLL